MKKKTLVQLQVVAFIRFAHTPTHTHTHPQLHTHMPLWLGLKSFTGKTRKFRFTLQPWHEGSDTDGLALGQSQRVFRLLFFCSRELWVVSGKQENVYMPREGRESWEDLGQLPVEKGHTQKHTHTHSCTLKTPTLHSCEPWENPAPVLPHPISGRILGYCPITKRVEKVPPSIHPHHPSHKRCVSKCTASSVR